MVVIYIILDNKESESFNEGVDGPKFGRFRRTTYLAMTETGPFREKGGHLGLRSCGFPLGMGYERVEKSHP